MLTVSEGGTKARRMLLDTSSLCASSQKVTAGQFGFLQLDFNQVALIAAPQPEEENNNANCQTQKSEFE